MNRQPTDPAELQRMQARCMELVMRLDIGPGDGALVQAAAQGNQPIEQVAMSLRSDRIWRMRYEARLLAGFGRAL